MYRSSNKTNKGLHLIYSSFIKACFFPMCNHYFSLQYTLFLICLALKNIKSNSVSSKQSGEASYNSHPGSTVVNAIGSRVFGTNRAAVNQSNRQVTQVPHKAPSFRTAGTELVCFVNPRLLCLNIITNIRNI